MKYQRRWYEICARGLCGKLCKIGVKTVDFSFYGPWLRCCFLVLEVCFALQCDFFVEQGFLPFRYCLAVHCSEKYCFFFTSWLFKIVLTNLASNRKCGWQTRLPVWLFWSQICNFWPFFNSFGRFLFLKKGQIKFGFFWALRFFMSIWQI